MVETWRKQNNSKCMMLLDLHRLRKRKSKGKREEENERNPLFKRLLSYWQNKRENKEDLKQIQDIAPPSSSLHENHHHYDYSFLFILYLFVCWFCLFLLLLLYSFLISFPFIICIRRTPAHHIFCKIATMCCIYSFLYWKQDVLISSFF